MLIVDVYTTTCVVNLCDLRDDVLLNGTDILNSEDLLRIDLTVDDLIAGFDYLTVSNCKCCVRRNLVFHLLDRVALSILDRLNTLIVNRCYNDCLLLCLLVLNDLNRTGNGRDDTVTLRISCFEDLGNTRETLCDIFTGSSDTTGVERSHRKLCTRLTD